MSDALSIVIAQFNPVVGDIPGNITKIEAIRRGHPSADLIVFPELSVSGYPPEDLVLKNAFLVSIEEAIARLIVRTADGGPGLLVGAPWLVEDVRHNAALLIDGGRLLHTALKVHLPNYGVFDEKRIFSPGSSRQDAPDFRGVRLGIMICEDMWLPDVAFNLKDDGAEILLVLNGSPFEIRKRGARLAHAKRRVVGTGLPLIYVNQVCGQDELVFDGGSFVLDGNGEQAHQLPQWEEKQVRTNWRKGANGWTPEPGDVAEEQERWEAIYNALMLGLRDYVGKNRFKGVLLGLSGGIDSALSAAVAADALGPDRVWCVMMPSPYTSAESLEDAKIVADLCGVRLDRIDIAPAMEAFETMLAPLTGETPPDIAEENIQARSRGLTLMALSNKFGFMVLSTGNKSEMSVGYATLYGDMCGGYSVLKDVYKTSVFALSRWRNEHRPKGALGPMGAVMPERVIIKAPSAELRPNQTDQDSLPPYELLDHLLERMIENEAGPEILAAEDFDPALVRRVFRMLDHAEYKRRQAPPGVKITSRAFGRDRRYPLVNGFTDVIG
ncbi:NAD+ synthase [Alphaproteobacteria bacterium]|nr:NAD+ synthase [Alphaproteobacteria bacterium]